MIFMTNCYRSCFSGKSFFIRNILTILGPAVFVAGILFTVSSCEEDPVKIGRKLLPGDDFVTILSTDTVTVRSFTTYNPAVKSGNPAVSYLGQIRDPYFGTIDARFVTQVRLGAAWTPGDYVIDSIKLYLELLSVTGAVDKPQFLSFSEISRQIYNDSVYYSNQDVELTGFGVTDIPLPRLKPDSVNYLELDIPLDFGEYITRDTSMLFHHSTNPDFRSYFRGLLFEITSPEEPVFVSLSVEAPGTYETYQNYFVMFMHDADGNKKQFYFILDAFSKNAAFNLFTHDHSAADPDKRILHINDDYADTLTYVQIMNGLNTKLMIPGLSDIKNDPEMKNISVNKARLILPVHYDNKTYKPSTIPSRVFLNYFTKSGRKYTVPDYSSLNPGFYDGTPDTTNNVFNINISTWLQNYLKDSSDSLTTDFELFLLPTSSNNVILKANDSHSPVRFEITYTKF